jgi:hypothetical protein
MSSYMQKALLEMQDHEIIPWAFDVASTSGCSDKLSGQTSSPACQNATVGYTQELVEGRYDVTRKRSS